MVTPKIRFDERDGETEHGKVSEAPATERAGNRYAKPKTTAPHLDSTIMGGVRIGTYTRGDVNEAARAFTGWMALDSAFFHGTASFSCSLHHRPLLWVRHLVNRRESSHAVAEGRVFD
jgi:hypothetical protein